jgi:hypothetical protein
MKDYTKTFEYLRTNKQVLLLEKKAQIKHADGFSTCFLSGGDDPTITKDIAKATDIESDIINVKVAINSTNIIDSHMDLHVNGLWKKSLKENKDLYLFQEHTYKFDHIISEDVKASTVIMSWKELGYPYEGSTEILLFDANIDKDNEFMRNLYKKGKVKNHSVGMRYMKLFLAMNSDSKYDAEEKEIWDKYYPIVANKSIADEYGFFYVVTEAKVIEGSAVPIGSNRATPVISISEKEPPEGTQIKEPSKDTLTAEEFRDLFRKSLIKN